ncbi:MAG TPA: flagellar hook basal-body protein [Tepidiformaceae bacterium]|jgi:flagellar hook protein FlgE|nr:flagellar hook basal-body protein [Tepidiformaceae bacterium]
MPTILGAAASGMAHNQDVLDAVGHNLANVNTAAFKKFRALHEGTIDPLQEPEGGRFGVARTTVDLLLDPASVQPTGNPLHLAIEDASFLRVREPGGSIVFTRFGALDADVDGTIVAFGGRPVVDASTGEAIVLPGGWTSPAVDAFGNISALNPEGQREAVGQVSLASFANPPGLEVLGDGLYRDTANSGELTVGTAGSEGFAALRPGALESSNVDVAQEFTAMIIAQRAYSACAKTFAVGDEMLAIATKLTQ